jgi:hypothetical protein
MALTALIAACVAMAAAALGAGSLPISAAASGAFSGGDADPAARFAAFSAFGAGLLVSTGVAVVVPEAFHALMAVELAGNAGHEHGDHSHGHDHSHDHGGHVSHAVPDWAPGAALLAGVAVMQALDFLSSSSSSHGCGSALGGGAGTAHASDGEGEAPGPSAPGGRAYAPPADPALPQTGGRGAAAAGRSPPTAAWLPAPLAALFPPGDPAGAALLSMVVHAAADGIAVGAATRGGSLAAEWLVLAAMVAHKGPGALGLASLLVAARWPLGRARAGLALFAAASPAAALATYALLGCLGAGSGAGGAGAGGATAALALLFSGGTLLHAALGHVLPAASRAARQAGGRGAAMAAGAALPLLLSAVAPHGH